MGEFPNPATMFTKGSRAVELGKISGSMRTPAKKQAAYLRELKKRGLTDENAKWLAERIENPEANIAQIQKWLDDLILDAQKNGKPTTQILAIQQMINLHKAHHGEKVKSENLNVNVNMTIEEWAKRLVDE